MYCLYSVFFSFLIPDTLFPFTLVFLVDLNPVNPIASRISAISGSESKSTSMASFSLFLGGTVEEAVPLAWPLGFGDEVLAGGGAFEGGGLVERGPVGGARSVGVPGRGLRDEKSVGARGGVRVLVRVEVWSFRGERERRDTGSSAATVSQLCHVYM